MGILRSLADGASEGKNESSSQKINGAGSVPAPFQKPSQAVLLFRRLGLSVLAAEALHTSSRIQHLLLAGKERMAVRANFYVESPRCVDRVVKLLPHAHSTRMSLYAGWIAAFMITEPRFESLDSTRPARDSATAANSEKRQGRPPAVRKKLQRILLLTAVHCLLQFGPRCETWRLCGQRS